MFRDIEGPIIAIVAIIFIYVAIAMAPLVILAAIIGAAVQAIVAILQSLWQLVMAVVQFILAIPQPVWYCMFFALGIVACAWWMIKGWPTIRQNMKGPVESVQRRPVYLVVPIVSITLLLCCALGVFSVLSAGDFLKQRAPVSINLNNRTTQSTSQTPTSQSTITPSARSATGGPTPQFTFLLSVNGSRTLNVVDGLGNVVRTVTLGQPASAPVAWSPDGSKIAYPCRPDNTPVKDYGGRAFAICVSNRDGSNVIWSPPIPYSEIEHPTWSPDGRKIAFSAVFPAQSIKCFATRNIVIFDIKINDIEKITELCDQDEGYYQPAWSPLGDKIAVVYSGIDAEKSSNSIYLINQAGVRSQKLTLPGYSTLNGGPAWSPDGQRLVYTSNIQEDYWKASLCVVNVGDRSRTCRSLGGYEMLGSDDVRAIPAWSPDGKWIAFSNCTVGQRTGVCVVPSDNIKTNPIFITEGIAPVWVP